VLEGMELKGKMDKNEVNVKMEKLKTLELIRIS
jgi:hypothetical protein